MLKFSRDTLQFIANQPDHETKRNLGMVLQAMPELQQYIGTAGLHHGADRCDKVAARLVERGTHKDLADAELLREKAINLRLMTEREDQTS